MTRSLGPRLSSDVKPFLICHSSASIYLQHSAVCAFTAWITTGYERLSSLALVDVLGIGIEAVPCSVLGPVLTVFIPTSPILQITL